MNNYPNFNDKVALVTGASSGMGLATTQAFSEAGASVALADVKEEAVREAAEGLVSEGHRVLAIACDVSHDAQVQAMIERTIAEFGRLDAAFNNAGVMAKIAPTGDSTLEEFDRVTGVDLGRLELHETRTAPDGTPGQRLDRQLLLYRRRQGRPGYSVLYRVEARGHRSDAGRGPRIRRQRRPRECGLPGHDRHGVCPRSVRGRERIRGIVKVLAHWPNRQARGDRVGGALAVQPGSELRGWARPGGRRWSDGGDPLVNPQTDSETLTSPVHPSPLMMDARARIIRMNRDNQQDRAGLPAPEPSLLADP